MQFSSRRGFLPFSLFLSNISISFKVSLHLHFQGCKVKILREKIKSKEWVTWEGPKRRLPFNKIGVKRESREMWENRLTRNSKRENHCWSQQVTIVSSWQGKSGTCVIYFHKWRSFHVILIKDQDVDQLISFLYCALSCQTSLRSQSQWECMHSSMTSSEFLMKEVIY